MDVFLNRIKQGQHIRLLEAHSALSAMIIENTAVVDSNGIKKAFDGIWLSSLTVSTIKGLPDIELVDITTKVNLIQEIKRVSSKPIVVDCDTGGLNQQFAFTVGALAGAGATAIVIEDKVGFKQNSLFDDNHTQVQDTIENFCDKIRIGKSTPTPHPIGIIARIESLVLGKGMEDALERAAAYISAGADGVLIHSKDKSPESVIRFAEHFVIAHPDVPLVCVPSKFNSICDEQLFAAGFHIVIHANHLLRAAYPAMFNVAVDILTHDRSYEVSDKIMSIDKILTLIPGSQC